MYNPQAASDYSEEVQMLSSINAALPRLAVEIKDDALFLVSLRDEILQMRNANKCLCSRLEFPARRHHCALEVTACTTVLTVSSFFLIFIIYEFLVVVYYFFHYFSHTFYV